MSDAQDARRIRSSASRVGLLVGAASVLVLTAGVVILIAVLLRGARPEEHHGGGSGGFPAGDGDRIVVDVDDILPWIVALGLIGAVLLALVGWWAARWAVGPLAAALRSQRNFVSDASHELRTPLTALTSRIQIAQRRHARGEPIDDVLTELRRDASAMDDVLTDMLMSAESATADAGADPAACLEAAVSALRPQAEEAGVDVVTDAETGAVAAIPAVTLTRLCIALLDNALQHAPSGSPVHVSSRTRGAVVEVRVRDGGTGVAPQDVERIFERFARSGESGRRRGFGLGLSLVREAAQRYRGSVRIEETSASGTTFLLTLPRR